MLYYIKSTDLLVSLLSIIANSKLAEKNRVSITKDGILCEIKL